jgi:hypothetical protein
MARADPKDKALERKHRTEDTEGTEDTVKRGGVGCFNRLVVVVLGRFSRGRDESAKWRPQSQRALLIPTL